MYNKYMTGDLLPLESFKKLNRNEKTRFLQLIIDKIKTEKQHNIVIYFTDCCTRRGEKVSVSPQRLKTFLTEEQKVSHVQIFKQLYCV